MKDQHYSQIASDFEKRWFFNEEYVPSLSQQIAHFLKAQTIDSYLDLGCGTGLYARSVLKENTPSKIIGVDLSKEMVEIFNQQKNFQGYADNIEDYLDNSHQQFDAILLKEVIHHLQDRHTVYKNLVNNLSSSGRALIITRPRKVEFPFFQAALDVFAQGQPSLSELEQELIKGQINYQINKVNIPIKISKPRLLEMTSKRFMSIFSAFNDSELARGIQEMEENLPMEIEFSDRLHFILLARPDNKLL